VAHCHSADCRAESAQAPMSSYRRRSLRCLVRGRARNVGFAPGMHPAVLLHETETRRPAELGPGDAWRKPMSKARAMDETTTPKPQRRTSGSSNSSGPSRKCGRSVFAPGPGPRCPGLAGLRRPGLRSRTRDPASCRRPVRAGWGVRRGAPLHHIRGASPLVAVIGGVTMPRTCVTGDPDPRRPPDDARGASRLASGLVPSIDGMRGRSTWRSIPRPRDPASSGQSVRADRPTGKGVRASCERPRAGRYFPHTREALTRGPHPGRRDRAEPLARPTRLVGAAAPRKKVPWL